MSVCFQKTGMIGIPSGERISMIDTFKHFDITETDWHLNRKDCTT